MDVLVMALYAEGTSDARFLAPLIQRAAEKLIALHGEKTVDVLDITVIPRLQGRQEEGILKASRTAYGRHALIVHADADDRTRDRALRERIQPGFERVRDSSESLCKDVVPLVPVQMVEAWMLADDEILCEVIGVDIRHVRSYFPARSSLVEGIADPKHILQSIISQANSIRSHNRRPIEMSTRFELLARQIRIEKLEDVASFRQFTNDLRQVLAHLHFIRQR